MHEAWIQFLVEHPTRGGLADMLIFEAGWKAATENAAKIAEQSLIPEQFRKTGMYTDFEEGGDECLKAIAATIRNSE